MKAGTGYIIKTRVLETGEDPFIRRTDTGPVPLGGDQSVPIKLTFRGRVIADPEAEGLPTTSVKTRWNLTGPHAESDTTVGLWLEPGAELHPWQQVIAFNNRLDVAFEDGTVDTRTVRLPDGELKERPEILLPKKDFVTLTAPKFLPPSGSPIAAGSALWLFMGRDDELPPLP